MQLFPLSHSTINAPFELVRNDLWNPSPTFLRKALDFMFTLLMILQDSHGISFENEV